MMDPRKIDGHKLHLHPDRVQEWREGKQIYPIYVEVSPTSICNFKCSFCALDFMKRGPSLEINDILAAIREMASLGVKSIMFAGEGEPLIYKDFLPMALGAKQNGIDISLTTNGSLMPQELSYNLLPIMSWIKVSLCSTVLSTFNSISGFDRMLGARMLGQVILNIYEAVEIRNKFKHKCDIGIQMLVTEENVADIYHTIITAREIGVDYIVLKQYSHHPSSINQHVTPPLPDYTLMSTDRFKVIQRHQVFGHNYDKCYALPFWSYIASNGEVYACSSHIPDPRFYLGSIYENTLKYIWDKDNYVLVNSAIDVAQCRTNCRMDACNEYLHELMNPGQHVNFI